MTLIFQMGEIDINIELDDVLRKLREELDICGIVVNGEGKVGRWNDVGCHKSEMEFVEVKKKKKLKEVIEAISTLEGLYEFYPEQ